jgi:hypothetical protein
MNRDFKHWLQNQKYSYINEDKWIINPDHNIKINFGWDNIIVKYRISERMKILLDKLYDKRNAS